LETKTVGHADRAAPITAAFFIKDLLVISDMGIK
jgi:hypothetical protein